MTGISPIAPGDDVAADVAGAQAAAEARFTALAAETFGQGSVIGDLMQLAPVPNAESKHAGGSDAGYPA